MNTAPASLNIVIFSPEPLYPWSLFETKLTFYSKHGTLSHQTQYARSVRDPELAHCVNHTGSLFSSLPKTI